VIRNARSFGIYSHIALLQWSSLRSFVATLVINQSVTPLIGLAVWMTALPGNAHISTYYAMLLVVQLVTVSYENHTLSARIYDGELLDDLLRPIPVFLRPAGENIAIRAWHLLLGFPVVLAVLLLVPLQISPLDAVAAIPALALACVLRFLFSYNLAVLAFWTQRADNAVGFGLVLIFLVGGGAAPIELMPAPADLLCVSFRSDRCSVSLPRSHPDG
jgi:ABC-2 type transport system permease protein